MVVSLFENFHHHLGNELLSTMIERIIDGTYKECITPIRQHVEKDEFDKAAAKKKKLIAFTPSGTFEFDRKADKITTYSYFLVLDIDKIDPAIIPTLKAQSAEIVYTYASFISPSGNGLKILVPVNSDANLHKIAFLQVSRFYAKHLNVTIDPSGKDVSRLCFVSYDPDCFYNPDPHSFIVQPPTPQPTPKLPINTLSVSLPLPAKEPKESSTDFSEAFSKCVALTEGKLSYQEGNRNNFVHLLACNCNRAGIPSNIAETQILQHYDLDSHEATATIHSAYANNQNDFAKFANSANFEQTTASKDELLLNMPFLPDHVFEHLPSILKVGALAFQDRRERDVFLTGALGVLSGCLRNLSGLYRAKEHYANLFVFIIAPAASGKGSLTFSKILGDKFHDKLVNESKAKQKVYQIELQEYKRVINDKKQNHSQIEPPEEPPFKVLFIPGNNSSARVIQHLQEGDEQGIFCETEADTIGNVFKQDWGSYSDLLRKSYHHEPISYSRKTNKEWVEIKKPRLSVALAGTPGQVENLIKSAEDGLFSRFIFYIFKSDLVWQWASESINGINLSAHFEQLSARVLSFVEYLNSLDKVTFRLTPSQWERLNKFGEESLLTLATFVSEDMSSTSKRLGLILYRVSMIITALRYFDNAEFSDEFLCSDQDFQIALDLVMVYQEHSVYLFRELPKQSSVTDKILKQFFHNLPVNFRRKDAIVIADTLFAIKERTADLYLSKLVTFKWLDKTKNGIYQKT